MPTLILTSLSNRGIYGQAWLDSDAYTASSEITISMVQFCLSTGLLFLFCTQAFSWAASVVLLVLWFKEWGPFSSCFLFFKCPRIVIDPGCVLMPRDQSESPRVEYGYLASVGPCLRLWARERNSGIISPMGWKTVLQRKLEHFPSSSEGWFWYSQALDLPKPLEKSFCQQEHSLRAAHGLGGGRFSIDHPCVPHLLCVFVDIYFLSRIRKWLEISV